MQMVVDTGLTVPVVVKYPKNLLLNIVLILPFYFCYLHSQQFCAFSLPQAHTSNVRHWSHYRDKHHDGHWNSNVSYPCGFRNPHTSNLGYFAACEGVQTDEYIQRGDAPLYYFSTFICFTVVLYNAVVHIL